MANNIEYGIKYQKIKIDSTHYLLVPVGLLAGQSKGRIFHSEDKSYQKVEDEKSFKRDRFLVDGAYTFDELCGIYDYPSDERPDEEFIREYYFQEKKEDMILVVITETGLRKKRLSIKDILTKTTVEIYEKLKNTPAVTLNLDSLEELLSIEDITTLKERLKRYKSLVASFADSKTTKGTTRIEVSNGQVTGIETPAVIQKQAKHAFKPVEAKAEDDDVVDVSGVSLKGLEEYIKERVFGHDEEIEIIAKTIIMNYRAKKKYKTEPLLIVGPTGTGKTATIEAAAQYLSLPFVDVNTANLVAQGIKGSTIEDYLYSLIIASEYDLKKAQRSFIFFDELDKLGESNLEIKSAVKHIMLKFLEGTTFLIDKDKASDDYSFDTTMLNKAYAGAFQALFDTKASIGFGASQAITTFNRKKIYDAEYFGKELVTRIPHIIVYNPLDRVTQKRAILHSKLSVLLQKKQRYEEEFGVTLEATDDYIEAVLDTLEANDKSMRDVNNIILESLNQVERTLLNEEGHVRRLILMPETLTDHHKFTIE